MAKRKPPQRMTKKKFVKMVTSGNLSADRAIGNMVDELQRYERKYGMRSEVFYALILVPRRRPTVLNWAISICFFALYSKFPQRPSRYAL
jgi:hypothetical protein